MTAWIEDDLNPEYSRLDRMDGLPRITQLDANRVLDEAKARRVQVSAKPAPFPPVSARVAADQKAEINLRPRRRVGGFVGTAFLFIILSAVLSAVLGVARLMGAL